MKNSIADRKPGWRERYQVHPAAAVFPMMPEYELDELAEDIKAYGLRTPITLWDDPKGGLWLMDGRNRLEAAERAGVELEAPTHIDIMRSRTLDPAAYVISVNIHRRHLTKQDQAALILRSVEAASRMKRQNAVRSFSPTPGTRGGSTTDPVLERAVVEAKRHNISKSTVKAARAKLRGKVPAPRPANVTTTKRQTIEAPTASAPPVVLDGLTIAEFLTRLRSEISARRKANHGDEHMKFMEQTELLNWIEAELDLVSYAQRGECCKGTPLALSCKLCKASPTYWQKGDRVRGDDALIE